LVKEGINGRGFVTSEDFATVLEELFSDTDGYQLARLRAGALEEGRVRWNKEWDSVAGRLLGLCD
jgi:beta-1,4-mannosyltransferase